MDTDGNRTSFTHGINPWGSPSPASEPAAEEGGPVEVGVAKDLINVGDEPFERGGLLDAEPVGHAGQAQVAVVVSYNDRNTWLDIWVHNLGFHKEVGMVWTDNGWQTANWSKATYELTWADGAERWGVDLIPIGQFMWHRSSAHGWVDLAGRFSTAWKKVFHSVENFPENFPWCGKNGPEFSMVWIRRQPDPTVENLNRRGSSRGRACACVRLR